ncbi:MAG TPA: DUF1552 domain-containing protein [Vicinamibacterales bacterium]|nr:DUF1552 domain-containing protein [Vicinamibacterales bacterium]
MFITGKHLSRRTALKGLGVTVALPLLEAMVPAGAAAQALKGKPRLVCIENVHGAAGSTNFGIEKNLWSPAAVGRDFDLSAGSLQSLEPFRDYLTIVSNTDVAKAEAYSTAEIGGDHFRASAVFLTQSHPKQTQGSDVRAGVSIDQLFAGRFGQDTPVPSMQLCIENVDQSGGCEYGYSCVYMDMISWASPDQPLPMIQDPRAVFDQLFGLGATPEDRRRRRREDRSVLDTITAAVDRLKRELGVADKARLADYLDDVREIERRIQKVEAANSSGEERQLPNSPVGVPDSFDDHVKLMFDLQALAFASDITRVFSFKLSRDVSGRVFPGTGVNTGFHNASHHNENEERIKQFEKINRHHVSLIPYFLDRLKRTADGDATLLDNTVVMYGSPMGNPNLHNHKRCPLFFAGKGAGALRGGMHVKAAAGTPMANAFLTLLHGFGLDDLASFGDSTGELSLTSAGATTMAAGI